MQFNLDDIAAMEQLDQGNDRSNRRLARSVEKAHEIGLKAEVPRITQCQERRDLRARGICDWR